jgi:hypothetical protein
MEKAAAIRKTMAGTMAIMEAVMVEMVMEENQEQVKQNNKIIIEIRP